MTRGSISDRTLGKLRLRWLGVAGLLLALQAPRASAECDSTSFDGSRSYPALGGSQAGAAAVAAGDFNRDGRPDLAVATPETDGVSVFMNQGDGTLGPPCDMRPEGIPTTWPSPTSTAMALPTS